MTGGNQKGFPNQLSLSHPAFFPGSCFQFGLSRIGRFACSWEDLLCLSFNFTSKSKKGRFACNWEEEIWSAMANSELTAAASSLTETHPPAASSIDRGTPEPVPFSAIFSVARNQARSGKWKGQIDGMKI
ncbi:unnamed protein product [Linum trigynum]|uniref:Uncharacterized protein n=1 Tax=Linum trigynum TaxID=586398 RepID=A0AAV2ETT0_9ROSI